MEPTRPLLARQNGLNVPKGPPRAAVTDRTAGRSPLSMGGQLEGRWRLIQRMVRPFRPVVVHDGFPASAQSLGLPSGPGTLVSCDPFPDSSAQ